SAVELLIANNKIKLMELNKKLDRETISFELCHVYFDLIKTKTQRRSSDFNKMRLHHEAFSLFNKDHKFLSILSIISRSYVLSSLEADLQEIQQKISHRIDFDTFFKVAQNFKSK
ncbi:unnamed protein product, partial [Rotaria sp. Silwood1]